MSEDGELTHLGNLFRQLMPSQKKVLFHVHMKTPLFWFVPIALGSAISIYTHW